LDFGRISFSVLVFVAPAIFGTVSTFFRERALSDDFQRVCGVDSPAIFDVAAAFPELARLRGGREGR
jgi:hypothetical protein